MIDPLGQCDYFQWSMIKSQPTPITKEGTSQSNHHWTFFTRLLLHTVTGSILNSYTDLPFFTGHFYRLPVVPHFSSEIVEWAKRERVWKSPHAGKGDTRRGERKMRPFLVWGDFHARLHFARSTILEEKWGTTRSLGHLGPFIHLGIKWPDEPIKARGFHYSWIRYQTFAQKKFYWEIGQCQKSYKYLLFKRSFYLWKSNNHQVFNHTKICLHTHISSLLPFPEEIVKELNQMIFKIWRKEPIKWQDFPQLTNMKMVV